VSGAGRLKAVTWVIVAVAVATVAGMAILWPSAGDRPELPSGLGADTNQAEVEEVTTGPCEPASLGTCQEAQVRLLDGPDEGETVPLSFGAGPASGQVSVGDRIRVFRAETPPGAEPVPADPGVAPGAEAAATQYSFVDFERRGSLLWLVLLYAAVVIAFARLRGVMSLLGLALSLGIVLFFIVPAILSGTEPVPVAIVGAFAVMLVTIPLVHGVGAMSRAAMLGTTASLLLTIGLALIFTELARLTGLAYDEAVLLEASGVEFSFQGLLLAGMVIGALGVLDDVTVSQSSTVFQLRAANPAQAFRELYGRAITVGRDHVAAVVNTLVLAYAGAALPVLLIFGASDIAFGNVLNLEVVAREVVATLVGSIGLVAAVPITTGIAVWLARGLPEVEVEAAAEQAHSH